MLNYNTWKLVGFPEDPIDFEDQMDTSSFAFESILGELHQFILTNDTVSLQAFMMRREHIINTLPSSSYQQTRFWFLLGRAANLLREWLVAIDAFEHCHNNYISLLPEAQIHLFRSWVYAYHQAHRYEESLSKYERLINLLKTQIAEKRTGFIADAPCLLCNTYRNLALAWLYLGMTETAQRILEEEALPLIRWHIAIQEVSDITKDQHQWRELRLFIPWQWNYTVAYRAKLCANPRDFEQSLYEAHEAALYAAQESQLFPEGRVWTTAIYSSLAETVLLRCELAPDRVAQARLCHLARKHMQSAEQHEQHNMTTLPEHLRVLVQQMPKFELALREHVIFDTSNRMDDLMQDVATMRQQAESVPDSSYRLLSARCSYLLGRMEAARYYSTNRGNCMKDPVVRAHFQQALDLLEGPVILDRLLQKEIYATIERLEQGNC